MREPTQQYSDLINSLQSRIQALEDENRLLKERLDEVGVSYADIVSGDAEGVVKLYDPNCNDVVAIYPMLENNLCQLLVFDFDNHAKGAEQEDYANIDDSWKGEINALRRICKNLNVDAVVERSRSGRGAHLWIFFKEMIPARLARKFGFALLEKGAESVNLKSFKYYDRMIPA